MMDYVEEQQDLLNGIYKETFKNQKELQNILKDEPNVNVSMYREDLIRQTNQELNDKYQKFHDDLYKIQKHKFRFQVSSLVLFIIISIVGVAGYWVRREYIPWIASIILLLLSIPVFAMAGLETTYTFLSIDFCSSIGNSIISGITPSEDKGIGTYLSCPSKEAMRSISTAIYQYIISFDYLYNQVEQIFNDDDYTMFNDFSLGTDKRNNTYFQELYNRIKDYQITNSSDDKRDKEKYRRKKVVLDDLKSFGILNVLLAGLLSMTSCYTAKNSINYIEEKYCYKNHAYMFRNVIFDTLAALGFVIISVGLNKLIITMRTHFARALRGKKEFNTDIINDDDD
jgi:hypothetical protein